jgi:hypothetical protein
MNENLIITIHEYIVHLAIAFLAGGLFGLGIMSWKVNKILDKKGFPRPGTGS